MASDGGAGDYPPDVEVLMDRVVKQGLPCHIVAVAEEHGFFMLKLEPLEGWQHIATPQASQPDLNTPKAAAERVSTGTTAEEQKKRLAGSMYPSSRGLREYGAGTT